MLVTYFLSKNIKIRQVTSSFQWLTVTLRVINTNSLLLNVNDDSDSSNSTKKNINYLDKREELHKRNVMGKKITETAKTLSSSRMKPSEEILDTLLTNISNIKNSSTVYAFNKINEYKKNVSQKVYSKHIRTQGRVMDISDQAIKRKHDRDNKLRWRQQEGGKSSQTWSREQKRSKLSQMELREQKERRDRTMVNTKYDRDNKLSVAATLLKKQNRRMDHKQTSSYENNHKSSEIAALQEHRNMNYDTRMKQQKPFDPSTCADTAKDDQWKIRYTHMDVAEHERMTEDNLLSTGNEDVFSLVKIFDDDFVESSDVPKCSIWDACEAQQLQLFSCPTNAIEQMIQWTEQGKLWKFPIDNEQDMKIEQNVHFSRHVFLERHLAEWCPAKGPIRHFMELVCVGLSKNPYMTIEEKEEHLMWYRNYFNDKTDLLQELNLIE